MNYKNDPRNHSGRNTGGGDGTFSFNMLDEEYFGVSLNTNVHLKSVECYYCHKKGYYKNKFSEKLKAYQDKTQKVTGQQHTQIAIEREDDSGTELASWYDRNDYFDDFCMTQLSHTFEEPETGNV